MLLPNRSHRGLVALLDMAWTAQYLTICIVPGRCSEDAEATGCCSRSTEPEDEDDCCGEDDCCVKEDSSGEDDCCGAEACCSGRLIHLSSHSDHRWYTQIQNVPGIPRSAPSTRRNGSQTRFNPAMMPVAIFFQRPVSNSRLPHAESRVSSYVRTVRSRFREGRLLLRVR